MDNNGSSNSRIKRFEKRRQNSKFIKYFAGIASVLALFLIFMWIFSGGDDSTTEGNSSENANQDDGYFLEIEEDDEAGNEENTDNNPSNPEEETNENNSNEESNEEEEENNESNDVIVEETAPSDDNVSEAYTGNWQPIGTEQTGPHTTDYVDGSQDRIEIKEAVSMVTGIPGDDMIEWWVGRSGDQEVIVTVSDQAETETYRVYLSWVNNEGWQPTKLETLIENDQK